MTSTTPSDPITEPAQPSQDDSFVFVGLECPRCLEQLFEADGADGPDGNLWHEQCLISWREE